MTVDSPVIKGQSLLRKTLTTLFMISAFLGLAVLGWFANEENQHPHDYANLPLIKANTEPFKIKPTDPGGMQVKNTKIQLYDEITTDVSHHKRTDVIDLSNAKLSSPPEEPVKLEQPVKLVKLAEQHIDTPIEKLKEVPLSATNQMKKVADEILQSKLKTAPETGRRTMGDEVKSLSSINPIIQPVSKPVAKAVEQIDIKPAQIKAVRTHSYDPRYKRILLSAIPSKPDNVKDVVKYMPIKKVKKLSSNIAPKILLGSKLIQLGSYQSRASVKSGWKNLQKKYSKELGALSLSIKAADLGPRGVYYRLLVGPFKNKSDAAKMCKRLTSKGQDCLVAR